jgi:predicted metal-dependent peptidase
MAEGTADALASAAPASALHAHRGTRAVQRLVEFAPSTGGLALWMHHRDEVPPSTHAAPAARSAQADQVAPVRTDGHCLYYAPGFARLSLPAQSGAVAHALLHVALRHPQRLAALQQLLGDVDTALFNVCADAIVNSALSHLAWIELPADAVRLEALLQRVFAGDTAAQPASALSPEAALAAWDVEALYRAIDDRQPDHRGGSSGQSQPRSGGQSQATSAQQAHDARSQRAQSAQPSQAHRPDGPRATRARALGAATAPDLLPAPGGSERPEDEAEAAREWGERLQRAPAGDGEFSLLRSLLADLPRVHTPWEQVLRRVLARALVQQPGPSWSRPSRSYLANQGRTRGGRRLPWEPGTTPSRAVPRLVLMVDVSGSIDDTLLQRFTREIDALVRRLGAGLTLVIGDDRVRQVLHFEPGRTRLQGISFAGGGGTDFTPLLEEADRHRPDIGVLLTDLDGGTRYRPAWPLLWAVPESLLTAGDPVLPFGRLLKLR